MNRGQVELDQPSLLDPSTAAPDPPPWAAVAQVLVDTGLPHLDRPFDYGVPAQLAGVLEPGMRVKVRFAGRDRDGFVLELTQASQHHSQLSAIRRVVGEVPVLAPEILRLARSCAARFAGSTSDILRLAIPPRHAGAEKSVLAASEPQAPIRGGLFAISEHGGPWDRYGGGPAFLRRLADGQAPRAVWSALPPTPDWAGGIAAAVRAVRASGRGALVLLPDARDVAIMERTLAHEEIDHVALTADQGASARYRWFLQVLLGRVQVVIGTRSAAFAPVANLGLVVCWDDGDDLYEEPRTPYPHTREILIERAEQADAAVLIGGYARTPAAQQLVTDGWARLLQADRRAVRRHTPRVIVPSAADLARDGAAGSARFPRPAWELVRRALAGGPVLIQTPRAGYLPVIACARCRAAARCQHCHGRLALPQQDAAPVCAWCGRRADAWRCEHCHHHQVRAARVGSLRTAQELGRAFPGATVVTSGRDGGVIPQIDDGPRLVVATPGAEPVAAGGYTGAVLLDGAVMAARDDLDASSEALRRWFNAAALVRSSGEVMLLGSPPPAPAQALLRWDPTGYADRELAERADLRFPPLARLATLTGSWPAVRDMLRRVELPGSAQILGPTPDLGEDGTEHARAIVRVPRADGGALATALRAAVAYRSAHKLPVVRIRIDPSQV